MLGLLNIEHLEAWTDVTPEDAATFERYRRELTVAYALRATLTLALCAVVWWPLDWVVAPDARYREAFEVLRTGFLALQLAIFVAFLRVPAVRAHATLAAVAGYGAVMGFLGYALGRLGGPDLPWFADTFIGLMPTTLLPLTGRERVGGVALIAACLLAGHFVPFPEHLRNPYAGGQASFVVFASVVAVVAGELTHRTVRRSFFQGRSVARAREELAVANAELQRHNDALADRVAARTGELRRLAAHLDDALEQERGRTSREIHDELGQEVSALRYALDLVVSRYDEAPDGIAPQLARLDTLVDRTAAAARGLVTALRPHLLETLGFEGAVDAVLARLRAANVAVELRVAPDGWTADSLTPEQQHVAFRVIQEACTNVMRHAEATRFSLALSAHGGALEIDAQDDGVGLNPGANGAHFGLLGMRERLAAAGGTLSVGPTQAGASRPGVRLVASLPTPGATP